METKDKLFFWVFGLVLLLSVGFAFLKYVVFLDYVVMAEIDCDPAVESCFVYRCNPKEEECTGDMEEDTWYYKIISKKAYNFPDCDPAEDENCVIECGAEEKKCEITLCEDLPTCMTPEKYQEEIEKEEEVEGEKTNETEGEAVGEAVAQEPLGEDGKEKAVENNVESGN